MKIVNCWGLAVLASANECALLKRTTGRPFSAPVMNVGCRGKILFYRGDYRGAAEGYTEALALSRKSNNKRDLAIGLTEFAFLSYHQDDEEQTYLYASEALSLFFEMEHLWDIATILSVLAATAARRHLFARAALLCGAVEACRSRINAQLFDEYEALYTCASDAARAALGTTTFIQSSLAGQNMPLEQIVAYAQERAETAVDCS